MMGQAVPNLDIPVVKGTSGTRLCRRRNRRTQPLPCVRCGQCIAVRQGTQPDDASEVHSKREWEKAEEWGLRTCMGVAPALSSAVNIPLAVVQAG